MKASTAPSQRPAAWAPKGVISSCSHWARVSSLPLGAEARRAAEPGDVAGPG